MQKDVTTLAIQTVESNPGQAPNLAHHGRDCVTIHASGRRNFVVVLSVHRPLPLVSVASQNPALCRQTRLRVAVQVRDDQTRMPVRGMLIEVWCSKLAYPAGATAEKRVLLFSTDSMMTDDQGRSICELMVDGVEAESRAHKLIQLTVDDPLAVLNSPELSGRRKQVERMISYCKTVVVVNPDKSLEIDIDIQYDQSLLLKMKKGLLAFFRPSERKINLILGT